MALPKWRWSIFYPQKPTTSGRIENCLSAHTIISDSPSERIVQYFFVWMSYEQNSVWMLQNPQPAEQFLYLVKLLASFNGVKHVHQPRVNAKFIRLIHSVCNYDFVTIHPLTFCFRPGVATCTNFSHFLNYHISTDCAIYLYHL